MAYDVQHALEHAEVAGWALQALDPADARAFEDHIRARDHCQAAVAEFEPVAQALRRAAPEVEPPDYLEAKTIAAVQHAVMSARRPEAKPELITAGTFVVDRSGGGTFSMWSAADLAKFKIMQITAEQPGDASQHGRIILSGVART